MKAKNKSNLLLIELILAILFFSITASICVRVIFSAHEMSRQNSVMTKATITGDSIVSIFRESDINIAKSTIAKLYKTADISDSEGYIEMYFDKTFEQTDSNNARYVMSIEITEGENYLRQVVVRIKDNKAQDENKSNIYSLSTTNFIQKGDGK